MRQYISKIPLFSFLVSHPPEPVFDVPFCHKKNLFLFASANACIICVSKCPSWSIAPQGEVLIVVPCTDGQGDTSDRHNVKERSKLDLNAFDLCGIAAIGKILTCDGGESFISSHFTRMACPTATFAIASRQKCLFASGNNAEQCGPQVTALYIASVDQGLHASWATQCGIFLE